VKKIEGDYLDAVVFRQIVIFVKVVSKIEIQMSIVKSDPEALPSMLWQLTPDNRKKVLFEIVCHGRVSP